MRISDWSSDVCSSDLILIIIVVDLNHGRIGAGTEAFDLSKRKKTIGCRPALDQSLVLTGSEHIVRTAQHTGRRAANLYMIATHRRQIIHGVEGDRKSTRLKSSH